VGDHVRIGADNMLVAPVEIGDGAYTAAGSVITEDVPPGALGVARGKQHNSEGWVERRRPGTPAAAAAARARQAAESGIGEGPGQGSGESSGESSETGQSPGTAKGSARAEDEGHEGTHSG
jgi:bifunctional UDP-N-acetylglucosamine pyrophosphorylase/glucosamine-1-phosphate N-acetyltransferase